MKRVKKYINKALSKYTYKERYLALSIEHRKLKDAPLGHCDSFDIETGENFDFFAKHLSNAFNESSNFKVSKTSIVNEVVFTKLEDKRQPVSATTKIYIEIDHKA